MDFRAVDTVQGRVHVACGRDPYFPPWRDVAQLNYFNPETREAMRRQLGKVAAHCDGVRCDMAMLVLNDVFERTWRARLHGEWPRLPDEFWPAATRSTPELMYIAEVYWDLRVSCSTRASLRLRQAAARRIAHRRRGVPDPAAPHRGSSAGCGARALPRESR